jgi:xylulokinase
VAANVLAIDLGTTGVKVAVVDESGAVLAHADEVLPMIYPGNGGIEQDPHLWWEAIGRCARAAMSRSGLAGSDVTIVAVTSQYTSTVAVAEDGMPLTEVVMWMDQRGRNHNRSVPTSAEIAARWVELHGMAPSGNDDVGHVALLRDTKPDVYAAARAFVEPMDYVAARLTGHVTATQNTSFPMLSCDNRTWGATSYSDELLSLSGLDPAKLAPLVPLGSPRGAITAAAAEHVGVSPNAIVADATIDSITSAVGTGTIDSSCCGMIIGTTTVIATHVPSKREDHPHGLSTMPSSVPGQYLVVAENGFGGKSLDWFVNNVVYPADGLAPAAPDDAYERVLAAAASRPAGANGALFLPWFAGSMAPNFQRRMRAGFVNLGLHGDRADMARAVLEGVAFSAGWLLPFVAKLAEQTYAEVSFGGGGARSALWGQVLADTFGVPVRRLANSHTTNAQGAALVALCQNGAVSLADIPSQLTPAQVHEPDPAAVAVYARARAAHMEFHDTARPFYESLDTPEAKP